MARPDTRPVPIMVMAGSTTPAGNWSLASKARKAFTSASVTVVRWGCGVGRALKSVMPVTFRFSDSASARDGAGRATSATVVSPASNIAPNDALKALRDMHFQYRCTHSRLQLLVAAVLAVVLPRAGHQIDLAAFHLLFEHAEFCLLAQIQHLVDGV